MYRAKNAVFTILVADDFAEMRSTLKLWLEKQGYKVTEAENGEQALEVARRKRPDVILMDIGMPERSGISAAYKIHSDPELTDIPIIAITAYEAPDLHEDALKAGFIKCLTKPVDPGELDMLLRELL